MLSSTLFLAQAWPSWVPFWVQVALTIAVIISVVYKGIEGIIGLWKLLRSKYSKNAELVAKYRPLLVRMLFEAWRFVLFVALGMAVQMTTGHIRAISWHLLLLHTISCVYGFFGEMYRLKQQRDAAMLKALRKLQDDKSIFIDGMEPVKGGKQSPLHTVEGHASTYTVYELGIFQNNVVEAFLSYSENEWRPSQWQLAKTALAVVGFWTALGIAIGSPVTAAQPATAPTTQPTAQP